MNRKQQTEQARASQDFHRNILENLSDGVMAVGLDGCIQDFNPAASGMFGLTRDDVLGKTLAEAFLTTEGFDEFIETILDAVVDQGEPIRKVVDVQTAEGQRSLTLTISRLTTPSEDGESKTTGVIAVFSDITEMKELRETEVRMGKELEKQHAELRTAYRKIEENRDELNTALKRVQVARVAATALILVLFLGVGVLNWGTSDSDDWPDDGVLTAGSGDGDADGPRTVVAQPREFRSSVSLSGVLEPWRQIQVTSPGESRLKRVHFRYGQHVSAGDRLIELDMEELRLKHQESRVEYENALRTMEEYEDWENSAKMSQELRSYRKAKMDLERAESELRTSAFLLEQGLIPSSQHEDQKRRYESQLLDFEAIEQSLAATRAEGRGHSRQVAELELEKTRKQLRMLEEGLRAESIVAPVTGTIMPLKPGGEGLAEGQMVARGMELLTIADSEKMVATTSVDEAKITKIEVAQPVTIRGAAFPEFKLRGTVSHVSTQASRGARGGTPRFKVMVELEPLDAEKKKHLRIGMSCQIRIVTYHNPEALMVPIDAVTLRGGKARLYIHDPGTGATEERQVKIGLTSLDSVEILSGLAEGERVVLPGN